MAKFLWFGFCPTTGISGKCHMTSYDGHFMTIKIGLWIEANSKIRKILEYFISEIIKMIFLNSLQNIMKTENFNFLFTKF